MCKNKTVPPEGGIFKSYRTERKVEVLTVEDGIVHFFWYDHPDTVSCWDLNADENPHGWYDYFLECEEEDEALDKGNE